MRRILELAEQAGDDEHRLLADVYRIVPDALDAAANEHHVHAPLTRVWVVSDLQGPAEYLAVEPVDLVVLPHEILRQSNVAELKGLTALNHLLACLGAHALNEVEQGRVDWGFMPRKRHELGHVHALVAHSLDVLDHMKEGRNQAKVAGYRRLKGEQREHALVNLEVSPVDSIVIGDDHLGQFNVLMLHRLERAIERRDHHRQRAESLRLEVSELFLEVRSRRLRHASRPCP
jgi:hypothetical protein